MIKVDHLQQKKGIPKMGKGASDLICSEISVYNAMELQCWFEK